MGKFDFYIHNKTNLFYYENAGKIYFLIGHAYNPFTMQYDENEILKRISEVSVQASWQDAIDEITGIFSIGYIENDKIIYMTDPSGMQSLCSGIVKNKFYLTSHAQLVGDLCDLQMSDIVKRLVEYKWFHRVMGSYLPGDMTQFSELTRVVPNIMYSYLENDIKHKRIYPLKKIEECKSQKEYEQIIREAADILKNNMYLVVQKWEKPAISLTGGIDSNTTFAAANGIYDKVKTFSYLSAKKETIDVDAAMEISKHFNVDHKIYEIPDNSDIISDFEEIKEIINHNNGYITKHAENEYRKRAYLIKNLDYDVEIKSWVSETIRAYWYKHYGRKTMPKLSAKLFRNLYKIFITNRTLAHEVDKIFADYIEKYEYRKIPSCYPAADMHYNEVTWGSWGGLNISEMKIYSDITIIYNNRKFLDLMFKIPLEDRILDKHHLKMKEYLNKELYDMNIRVVNMKETKTRAFLLNLIFTANMVLPF